MPNSSGRTRRVTKLVLGALVALAGTTQTIAPPQAASAASSTDLFSPIDWARDPGVQGEIGNLTPSREIELEAYGANPDDGKDDRPALVAAIAEARSLGGAVIHLPAGELHIDGRVNLADGVVIRGAGSERTRVVFTSNSDSGFQIGGGYPQQAGPDAPATVTTAITGRLGTTRLVVEDGSALTPGMLAHLTVGDQIRPSNRAGQVVEILETHSLGTGNQTELVLEEALSDDFAGFTVAGFTPIRGAGIEDLTLGPDDGVEITHLILLRGSADSWVTNIDSFDALKAHVMVRYSYHCEVAGNRFSDALDHGDGGRGYGVNVANRTTGCLIEDNDFELLRHSMLLQDGAVGNVVAFNRSGDARHINFPDGGPADISFHSYAVANLVEGNVVERIHLNDAGVPGPYNTILRNCLTSGPVTLDGPTRDERVIGNAMFGSNDELRSRLMPAFETLDNPRPYLLYNDVFDEDGVLILDPSDNLTLHQNWYQGDRFGSDLGVGTSTPDSFYGSSFAPILDDPSTVETSCQNVISEPVVEEPPVVDHPVEEPPVAEPEPPVVDPPVVDPPVVDDVTPPEATGEVKTGRGRNSNKVTIKGIATDDQAVDYVRVSVRDSESGLYLQEGLTTFGAEIYYIEVAVPSDGKFAAPGFYLSTGTYEITVEAVDSAGNVQTTPDLSSLTIDQVQKNGKNRAKLNKALVEDLREN